MPDGKFDIVYSSAGLLYFSPERRREMMEAYQKKTAPGGHHALNTFVKKPFIPRAPDSEDAEYYWTSGELFSYYRDWYFHDCREVVFDCESGGTPHRHCIDILIAEKR
ncbi:MAG: hypothetical protein FWF49_01220 [Oscillospiraceae bacterium]|nr:hypothetical protein [Oscillospiraceae bacterium]